MSTKISSIFDIGTTGVPVGSEMEIGDKTAHDLRYALNNSIGKNKGNVKVVLLSGDPLKGRCIFGLKFNRKDSSEITVTYEFNTPKGNGKTFLNVVCNPTILMIGDNTIPVIVKGKTIMDTFALMNRLPYQILEIIFEDEGFEWVGGDKNKLINGDINITQMQVAFYSGDLGKELNTVLMYLRTIYGGLDKTQDKVISLAEGLGLEVILYNNDKPGDTKKSSTNLNMTIVAKSNTNRLFSMQLYKKQEIIKDSIDSKRVERLIRFDCTLYSQFLSNNKINKLHMLEQKYKELCNKNEGKDDVGFTRWLSNKFFKRIKLPYILGLERLGFYKNLKKAKHYLEDSEEAIAKVFNSWYSGESYNTQADFAKALKITQSAISKSKIKLLEDYGIDIEISRSYMDEMFSSTADAMRTEEERHIRSSSYSGDNRRKVSDEELFQRSSERLEVVRKTIEKQGGLLKIRKLKPKKVHFKKLHIYRQMGIIPDVKWKWLSELDKTT